MNMKKTAIITLVMAVLAMALVSEGRCEPSFQNDFRGIAYGTHKDQLPDLGFSKKMLKSIYKNGLSAIYVTEERSTLDMHFDGAPLLSIFLRFDNQVFYGFDFVFKPEFLDQIRASLEKEMGSPGEHTEDGFSWNKNGLSVELTDREVLVEKTLP